MNDRQNANKTTLPLSHALRTRRAVGRARLGQTALAALGMGALLMLVGGCSEVTQTAEDCTSNQFFDLNAKLCRTCPPLDIPECPEDCSIGFEFGDQGCREAICDCTGCGEGSFFNDEALECEACAPVEANCADGCQVAAVGRDGQGCQVVACTCDALCNPTIMAEQGTCEPCAEVTLPEDCPAQCSFVNATTDQGCPNVECVCNDGQGG